MDLDELRQIERKWQEKWEKEKVFEADPDPSKPNFFITVPYPYTSGPLHIGHGRTYTIGDIVARYKRLKGYNVLFPMAFHITGTPIAAISDRIQRGNPEAIRMYRHYVSLYVNDPQKVEEILKSFTDPINVATFFAERIHIDFKALGYSIDWRRKFHTGEPIYNKFVEWQYFKLKEKNLLKQGSHYVTYCLLHKQPEGEDDIADADVNPVDIVEFVAIKFKYKDGYILASTLRPETIFGATNMWVNPSGKYVKVKYNSEILYISKDALVKFEHQYDKVEVLEEIGGEEFVGEKVIDPLGKELIILPAEFVDTDVATGFVYSEPSDAPYDYIALMDLRRNPEKLKKYGISPEVLRKIEPIKIIDVPGIDGHHAEVVVKRMGIESQLDERLEEATKIVYKEQYYNGVLNDKTGEFAGLKVSEAKEKVKNWLLENHKALLFYETSRKARCRAGGKIIIARIRDQWFIDYSQEWWKEQTKKWLKKMWIYPEKYKKMFFDTVDWLHERPCARRRGLGTRLPFDPEWIIESLSDSTIYMAFYTIVHYLRRYNISADQLVPEFFDYVFLGKGDPEELAKKTGIKKELLETMRKEFEYWYPVDQRHTGIPHISNHLMFFIMHHIAIFEPRYWPRAITLNELVIREGKKMAKSKGNVILLRDIAKQYSADLFRLYIAFAADLDTILDWKGKEVESVKNRLLRFAELAIEAAKAEIPDDFGAKIVDRWLLTRFYKRVKKAEEYLERMRIRDYIVTAFFEMLKDVMYYIRRVGEKRGLGGVRYILEPWIIILSPVIPHLAEEIWSRMGKDYFVSIANWPKVVESEIDERAEVLENAVIGLIDDAKEILKTMKKQPEKSIIIIAAEWKREILRILLEMKKNNLGLNLREVAKRIKENEQLQKIPMKNAMEFVQRIMKNQELIPSFVPEQEEELALFNEAKGFLEKTLGIPLEILREEDALERGIARAKYAIPLKPGINFQ
ncbi:MAG: leucine--tRNA ligase [Candidatus Njordarchaeales archaeon]